MITSIKVTNPILRLQPRPALLLTVAILLCLAFPLVPNTLAVSPPPDGGYPNGNTAEGDNALFSLTSGAGNTAIGSDVLFSNTTGSDNTATGFFALISNTTGGFNTAAGFEALLDNTTGSGNTAIGFNSLFGNTSANNSTAIGFRYARKKHQRKREYRRWISSIACEYRWQFQHRHRWWRSRQQHDWQR